jgi:lipooligosaccharide transport system permease protein
MSGVTEPDLVQTQARPRPVRSLYAGNARAVMLRG